MKKLHKITRLIHMIIDDLLYISGITCIAIGAFMFGPKAGYITLGCCLTITAILVAKKGGG